MITLQGRKVIREPKIESRWYVPLSLAKMSDVASVGVDQMVGVIGDVRGSLITQTD